VKVERQFLPAVLEIQETPPSPLGRALSVTIMVFLVLAVIWASAGKIDIVAVAHGKVIPVGRSKVIQPIETGRIVAINVDDGQVVDAGDLLIELDRTSVHADVERLNAEREVAAKEVARLERLAHWLEREGEGKPEMSGIGDPLLGAQWREYQARLTTLYARRREIDSRLATAKLRVEKLEALVPVVEKRAANERLLMEKKLFPEQEYLETEESRLQAVHDLKAQQSQVTELTEAARTVDAEIVYAESEFGRTVQERREEARRRLVAAEQELLKAREREAALLLHAPVDGVVHQLAVHTVGGVVTPAQQLMIIVPRDTALEVEALVKNKDIGFVEEGQPAELKLEAFPFTRYGTMKGDVIDISDDAVNDEQLGLVYRARVAMEDASIDVDGRLVKLSPGMTVTAEVKTGQRRLIEFLMSPVIRALKESARER
jgi:hemolysin D